MKYTEIHVKPFVYVSSTYDYVVAVLYKENGKPEKEGARFCRAFHLNSESFMSLDRNWFVKMPKYFIDEVLRQVQYLVETDNLKPYEYDRFGSKRWENLRYYNHNDLVDMNKTWGERC